MAGTNVARQIILIKLQKSVGGGAWTDVTGGSATATYAYDAAGGDDSGSYSLSFTVTAANLAYTANTNYRILIDKVNSLTGAMTPSNETRIYAVEIN